jgi:cysteine-rich repeat protein
VCDGGDLAGATCPDGGVLGCAADCRSLDTRGCWQCGNGRREGGEECDGLDVATAACDAPGETGGAIGCAADCRIDRAGCHRCGNGRVDPGEQCDDGNGDLRDGCTPACRLECGNGTVEPNEECDDGGQMGGDGCSALCALEASYDGGGDDARECALEWGVVGAAAATVTCTDGDTACDRATLAGECRMLAFFCFNRAPISSGSPPPCTPSNVAQVALTGGSLDGPGALEMDTVETLLGAFAATLGRDGASVTRTETSLSVVPPFAAPRACGAVVFSVPAGQDRVVATRTSDAAGSLDDDAITFRCVPGEP